MLNLTVKSKSSLTTDVLNGKIAEKLKLQAVIK
jgi:hypothetical protein